MPGMYNEMSSLFSCWVCLCVMDVEAHACTLLERKHNTCTNTWRSYFFVSLGFDGSFRGMFMGDQR